MGENLFTTKVTLELEIEVKAHISPYSPQTFHDPGEPAYVEDYQLFYKDVEITGELLDRIIAEHGGGIEDDLMTEADKASSEMGMAHAEHMLDLKEDR